MFVLKPTSINGNDADINGWTPLPTLHALRRGHSAVAPSLLLPRMHAVGLPHSHHIASIRVPIYSRSGSVVVGALLLVLSGRALRRCFGTLGGTDQT
jgi:hypothetical protein